MYSELHNKTVAADLSTWENEEGNVLKDKRASPPPSTAHFTQSGLTFSKINPEISYLKKLRANHNKKHGPSMINHRVDSY